MLRPQLYFLRPLFPLSLHANPHLPLCSAPAHFFFLMQGVYEIVYFWRLELISIVQITLQAAVVRLRIKVAFGRQLETNFSIQSCYRFTVTIVHNCPVSWCSITVNIVVYCNFVIWNSFTSYTRGTPLCLSWHDLGQDVTSSWLSYSHLHFLVHLLCKWNEKILTAFAIKSPVGKYESPVFLFSLPPQTDCAKWARPISGNVFFLQQNASVVLWKCNQPLCKNSHLGNAGLF